MVSGSYQEINKEWYTNLNTVASGSTPIYPMHLRIYFDGISTHLMYKIENPLPVRSIRLTHLRAT